MKKFLIITLCLLLFAVADELHQKFIPGRTVNPKDVIGNFAGIIAALIFCVMLFRNLRVLKERP